MTTLLRMGKNYSGFCASGGKDAGKAFVWLTRGELADAALRVGADVPFCLAYGAGTAHDTVAAPAAGAANAFRLQVTPCNVTHLKKFVIADQATSGSWVVALFRNLAKNTYKAGRLRLGGRNDRKGVNCKACGAAHAVGTARVSGEVCVTHTALATGVGEKLRGVRIRAPKPAVVLVNPRFEISTAEAYKKFALPCAAEIERLSKLTKNMIESHGGAWECCFNALERAVANDCTQIARMKELLLGSDALCAVMSGSGPTVFGLFRDLRGAGRAAASIRRAGYWTAECEFI